MHCGGKVEYGLQTPNFCPSCGKPFNQAGVARQEPSPQTVDNEIVADAESSAELPRISKLEYSIGGIPPKTTFGDLLTRASQDTATEYQKGPARPEAPVNPNEDILKTTMAECQSAKNPSELGE